MKIELENGVLIVAPSQLEKQIVALILGRSGTEEPVKRTYVKKGINLRPRVPSVASK